MCPIGLDIMEDPVMTCDGHTFDKKNIKDWFGRGNKTNPMTGAKLKNLDLIPNISLKNIISDFLGGIKKQK